MDYAVWHSHYVRHCIFAISLSVQYVADIVIWCVLVYCIMVNDCIAYDITVTNRAESKPRGPR